MVSQSKVRMCPSRCSMSSHIVGICKPFQVLMLVRFVVDQELSKFLHSRSIESLCLPACLQMVGTDERPSETSYFAYEV